MFLQVLYKFMTHCERLQVSLSAPLYLSGARRLCENSVIRYTGVFLAIYAPYLCNYITLD